MHNADFCLMLHRVDMSYAWGHVASMLYATPADLPRSAPAWLRAAKWASADITFPRGYGVVWRSGDWYGGVCRVTEWHGGNWYGGDWRGSMWFGGTWRCAKSKAPPLMKFAPRSDQPSVARTGQARRQASYRARLRAAEDSLVSAQPEAMALLRFASARATTLEELTRMAGVNWAGIANALARVEAAGVDPNHMAEALRDLPLPVDVIKNAIMQALRPSVFALLGLPRRQPQKAV